MCASRITPAAWWPRAGACELSGPRWLGSQAAGARARCRDIDRVHPLVLLRGKSPRDRLARMPRPTLTHSISVTPDRTALGTTAFLTMATAPDAI